MTAYKRPSGFWDASIWHYDDQHEWEKHYQKVIDYRIHKGLCFLKILLQ